MAMKKTGTARRIDVSSPELSAELVNKNPPPSDSFSWRLWLASQDIAQEALSSVYIQGIGNGTLDPNDYGIYNVHDGAYCYHAENDYRTAEEKAKKENEPEIAAFARIRYKSYVSYRKQAFDSWGLQDASALVPGPAVQGYIDTERYVATKAPPIYLIVAMIPCDQLWPWLAGELASKKTPSNVYDFWITGNASWHGAYVLDNFVDRCNAEDPGLLDFDKALVVYRACMINEVNCFHAATGQQLLPLPALPEF